MEAATPYLVILISVVVSLAGIITWAIAFRTKRVDDYTAKLERRCTALESRIQTLENNAEEDETTIRNLERERLRLLRELFRERNGYKT